MKVLHIVNSNYVWLFFILAGVGGGPAKKKVGIEIGKNAAEKSGGLFSAEDW